jgi:PhoPQ-activated pathogenicity-related protein
MGIARSMLCRRGVAALLLIVCGAVARANDTSPVPSAALAAYVERPDSTYTWRVRANGTLGKTRYVELIMSSQTWQDTLWRHQLYIIDPSNRSPDSRQALLFIDGGRWKPELDHEAPSGKLPRRAELFVSLAEKLRTPVVILRHVPYQPLFDGLTEDWIIALTFDRYLETGDADWPLLLPMVKTVVRAMDTTQAFAAKEWGVKIDSFTVSGASKRGWTTWLAGATDTRVTAIAPMVIDVVNMAEQMDHARATWGKPSHKILPYTERNLHERLTSSDGQSLLDIVDPYSYRHVLRQPKLIINGTNDEYWPLDALNLYWSELEGEKHILYVPNNGHGIKDYGRVLGSLVALHRHVAHGSPLPKLEWNFVEEVARVKLELQASMRARRMVAWVATSSTRDFRGARWKPIRMRQDRGGYSISLRRPRSGYLAVLGEGMFTRGFTMPSYFSTTVKIFGAPMDVALIPAAGSTEEKDAR